VKDGSLTGSDINASTLGQVPSSKTALGAETANSAGNANTVGGLPSSAFALSSRFLFGTASTDTATPQVVLTVPGFFQITTVEKAESAFKVNIVNLAPDEVDVSESTSNTIRGITKGTHAEFAPTVRAVLFVIRDVGSPEKAASVQCGSVAEPDRLECFASLSPAA
jgi:hypothetical protein